MTTVTRQSTLCAFWSPLFFSFNLHKHIKVSCTSCRWKFSQLTNVSYVIFFMCNLNLWCYANGNRLTVLVCWAFQTKIPTEQKKNYQKVVLWGSLSADLGWSSCWGSSPVTRVGSTAWGKTSSLCSGSTCSLQDWRRCIGSDSQWWACSGFLWLLPGCAP